LTLRSFALCDQIRALSIERLDVRIGTVTALTIAAVELRLRILLQL
jgi:mRNA-degrading endonuclease toxin of MazEF toxin-antitoxin module